eukprot:6180973-Pleurochrysis_carterae.AAC.1
MGDIPYGEVVLPVDLFLMTPICATAMCVVAGAMAFPAHQHCNPRAIYLLVCRTMNKLGNQAGLNRHVNEWSCEKKTLWHGGGQSRRSQRSQPAT